MGKHFQSIFVLTIALLASGSALALPFSAFDPRSFAMGGTGVAAGTSANAVFYNPALLAAARKGEDFSLELPIIGARVADPENLLDAVDNFDSNTFMSDLDAALASYSPPTPSPALAAAALKVRDALIDISGKAVQVEGDVGFVVGIPSKKFGISVYANSWAIGGVIGDTSTDVATLNQLIADAGAGAVPSVTTTGDLQSTISARFAIISEAGIAIARNFDGLAVGITPKYVEVKTSDYLFDASQFDSASIDLNTAETTDSDVNVDIGLAKDFHNGFKTGIVVKNAMAQEYTTSTGSKLKIEPMARLGGMYQNSWSTVALDVDLTENDPGGFDSKTQYASLGMELNLVKLVQLRVGVRHNMVDNPYGHAVDTLSAGLGFSPFGVHLDLSVAGNSDELGAAMQLGFRF